MFQIVNFREGTPKNGKGSETIRRVTDIGDDFAPVASNEEYQ